MKQLVVLGAASLPRVLAMVSAVSYWLGDGDLGRIFQMGNLVPVAHSMARALARAEHASLGSAAMTFGLAS